MKISYKNVALIMFSAYTNFCYAQNNIAHPNDTIPTNILDSVIVNAYIRSKDATYLPDVQGMNIFAGKKTNTISFSDNRSANLPQILPRLRLHKCRDSRCGTWMVQAHR